MESLKYGFEMAMSNLLMEYRFNSLYREGQHEFVSARVGVLSKAGQRAQRPGIANRNMLRKAAQHQRYRYCASKQCYDGNHENRKDR